MPAPCPLFHAVHSRMAALLAPGGLSPRRITRLALLVTGIMAARSCVLAEVARELAVLVEGRPAQEASWARRHDHGPFPDRLPDLGAPSWDAHWRASLSWRFIFHFVRS